MTHVINQQNPFNKKEADYCNVSFTSYISKYFARTLRFNEPIPRVNDSILGAFVKDPSNAAILGGFFTPYLNVFEDHERSCDIYVFVDPALSPRMENFPTDEIYKILNKYLQPICSELQYLRRSEHNRYLWPKFFKFWYKGCGKDIKIVPNLDPLDKNERMEYQKVTINFTTAPGFLELLSTFNFEPQRIGYWNNQMVFSSWFIHGGPMNPHKNVSEKVLKDYEARGYTAAFEKDFNIIAHDSVSNGFLELHNVEEDEKRRIRDAENASSDD